MKKPPESAKTKPGRKEVLTEDLARRIIKMVELFPDSKIEVTWDNVIDQVKRKFGREFSRNGLSQKAWDGRKFISEAFNGAKETQRRQLKETAPKYADTPRSRLREIIANLQAENLALREQLEKVRAAQYDEVFSLLDIRTPLNQAVAARGERVTSSDQIGRPTGDKVVSITDAKAARPPRKPSKDPDDDD